MLRKPANDRRHLERTKSRTSSQGKIKRTTGASSGAAAPSDSAAGASPSAAAAAAGAVSVSCLAGDGLYCGCGGGFGGGGFARSCGGTGSSRPRACEPIDCVCCCWDGDGWRDIPLLRVPGIFVMRKEEAKEGRVCEERHVRFRISCTAIANKTYPSAVHGQPTVERKTPQWPLRDSSNSSWFNKLFLWIALAVVEDSRWAMAEKTRRSTSTNEGFDFVDFFKESSQTFGVGRRFERAPRHALRPNDQPSSRFTRSTALFSDERHCCWKPQQNLSVARYRNSGITSRHRRGTDDGDGACGGIVGRLDGGAAAMLLLGRGQNWRVGSGSSSTP
jgi:hypothetical protein